jgi:redox-sensitive bicupin YhaK (pirin superfamily)
MSLMPYAEPRCAKVVERSVELDIEARTRALTDGFTVRRLLPSMARRMVGPFIFLDHMGPVRLAADHGLDVRPHPHINLATVTYLFEGEILHRDSLGSEQLITPGAVNWMTAGRGIVHSERSPAAAHASTGSRAHGTATRRS